MLPLKNAKQWISGLLAMAMVLVFLPIVTLAEVERAQLEVVVTPAQDQDNRVIFEIDMKLKNGTEGQAIHEVRFSYKDAQIAAVDQILAKSNAYTRSIRIDTPLEELPERFSVEVGYTDFDGSFIEKEVLVDYKALAPKLTFTRTASAQIGGKDEKITLRYNLKNEGKIALADVQVYDDMEGGGLIGAVDVLYPGESLEYTHDVKMSQDVQSKPRVSFTPANSTQGTVMVLEAMDIKLHNPKLVVTLKSDYTAVQSGEAVTLTCNVLNEGNVAFSGVNISDPLLGNIVENTTIEVGKSYSWTKIIKPLQNGTYSCTVRATDAIGSPYSVVSNAITVQVADAPPSSTQTTDTLEVMVTANQTELQESTDVIFHVLVRNAGSETVNNVVILDGNGQQLQHVGMMPIGDKIFPITLRVERSTNYIFVVEGTLASGQLVRKASPSVQISVSADAPVPPAPILSPTPSNDLIVDDTKGMISPSLLALIVIGALLILVVVTVMVWIQLRIHRNAKAEAEEYNITPPPRQPGERYCAPDEDEEYDSFKEEVSRYATEYSRPQNVPREQRPVQRELRVEPLERRRDDDDDIPTVYQQRGPKEPSTRRNSK